MTATAPVGHFLEIPGKPDIIQHGGTAAAILTLVRHRDPGLASPEMWQ